MTCGVYVIKCKASGKLYIGSSQNIEKRWREHQHGLIHGKHHSKTLQRSWNKYGADDFDWEVVEAVALDQLHEREQYYLDLHKPFGPDGFNHALVAGSPRGVSHSEETRQKNREATTRRFQDTNYRAKHAEAQRQRYTRPEEKEAHYKARCSEWWVASPDGKINEITLDLKKFCEVHGLSRTRMGAMGRSETDQGSHRGWCCYKLEQGKGKHARTQANQAG